jgi:hypothetical protein
MGSGDPSQHAGTGENGAGQMRKRFIHKHTVIYGENTLILKQSNAMHTTNSAHTQLARIYRNVTGERAGRQCERGYLNPPGGPKKKAEK